MRICVDLDGTICYTKKDLERYEDVLPLPGAVETLWELKNRGYYIIIATARNMRTYNGNIGQVLKAQSGIITDWLRKFNIPYDELYFGKPHVDYFVDDKGLQFHSWEQIKNDLLEREKNV